MLLARPQVLTPHHSGLNYDHQYITSWKMGVRVWKDECDYIDEWNVAEPLMTHG
jgi:hypothetical protein